MNDYYLITIVGINLLCFFLMAIDKRKAQKKNYRISESTFFFLSVLGGFFGTILGSITFRHKTKKGSFQIKVIFGLILHLLFFILFNYL